MERDQPISGLGADTDVAVEPKGRARLIGEEIVRRWKHWLAIGATGVTTWFLYGINDTWSTDAIAFSTITGVLIVYTLVTLISDIE